MRKHLASPFDPWLEAVSSDPNTGLILIGTMALVMVGPEILTARLYLRGMLAKKLRKDIRGQFLDDVENGLLDPALKRVTAPIEARIEEIKDLVQADGLEAKIGQVHSRLEELDQALEARLDEITIEPVQAKLEELDQALGKHLTAIHDGLADLPARVRSSVAGSQGAEMKEIYKGVEAAEADVVQAYEMELSPEERLAGRIDQMEPSPEWQKKHEVGSLILAGVKEYVKEGLLARRGGSSVVNMRRIPSKSGDFPDVYGK